jgi:thymidylate synthase ThyX
MTNRDLDVFIPLVPSVLGAMLMSKVSRQKESFREDLIQMVEEDLVNLPKENYYEQFNHSVVVANGFMEKWGVNYGHSSIKELDTLQMCFENKSRWFTEILETVQPYKFMSYIEYSLRYNPPKECYIPTELTAYPELQTQYTDFCEEAFIHYEAANQLFIQLFTREYPELSARDVALKAFENARNLLPLSAKANMGMQSNLRAFCAALSELFAYEGLNAEVSTTAELMKSEAEKVSVGMVRHVEPSPYIKSLISGFYEREIVERPHLIYDKPWVVETSGLQGDFVRLERYGDLALMNRFDDLPNVFRSVGKDVDLYMSEGAHHQFIRHRAFDLTLKLPDVAYGILIPYEVVKHRHTEEAQQIESMMNAFYQKSILLYEALWTAGLKSLVPYVVLNCNIRRVSFFANAFGLAHFITLRKEKHAQDEIRALATDLHHVVHDVEKQVPGLRLDKNQE